MPETTVSVTVPSTPFGEAGISCSTVSGSAIRARVVGEMMIWPSVV